MEKEVSFLNMEKNMDLSILKEIIKNIECYEGHILQDDEGVIIKREALTAHIDLTMKYFHILWKQKEMDDFLERFYRQLWKSIGADAKNLLREMIFGVPLFHDAGKINPGFQIWAMKNRRIVESDIFHCVGKKHSVISSVLYMDYFLKRIKDIESKEDKKRLRIFLFLHGYIVERHHSDLEDFEHFLNSMEDGNGSYIVNIIQETACEEYVATFGISLKAVKHLIGECRNYMDSLTETESIGIYAYVRLLYSLLVASDYYATTEFMSGTEIHYFGNMEEIENWTEIFENTDLMKKIRIYQKEKYPQSKEQLKMTKDINQLRTEMLLDTEKVLDDHEGENMFYLEAPTGSGKSNTAIDLSFQMMKKDEKLKKIYYIYPFNTLVEQNIQSLKKVFGDSPKIFENIAVINSLTPIKLSCEEKQKEINSEDTMYYQKALLDRQFLNYPMIVSTHVSLFDTMFGMAKESAFGFHQLMNSVIVLDEIQSYKNTIWAEIIYFLKEFSYLLNMKIVIMSATLPNLDRLSQNTYRAVPLIEDKEKYFSNACFKNRVKISYELLEEEDIQSVLLAHVKQSAQEKKKILIEFIKKDSAFAFFNLLKEDENLDCTVEYMSGDDSIMERSRILNIIKENEAVILVSTQVIEAGIDIDMDIGYKNISKLDSEEQFLGRINRSCLKKGIVYFFKMDSVKSVYKNDVRVEKEFTLDNNEMRDYLLEKEFDFYYERVLSVLQQNINEISGEEGLEVFFLEKVGKLDFAAVQKRMELISADNWSMSVYLARVLKNEEGMVIDGAKLWEEYKYLLKNFKMGYAEKKVKLSKIKSQMNDFIYQIKKNYDLTYNDKIGEIFYIENGEQYFENGKLNRNKIQGEIGSFVEFI